MTEDEDISSILSENLPTLDNTSEPRDVMRAFRQAAYETQCAIEDILEAEPDLERRTDETDRAVIMISDELHHKAKTWEQFERGLKLWLVRPVADAIRTTVSKLAELLGQERRAEQDKPKQDGVPEDGGKKPAAAAKPISTPKGGFEPG